ncbi:FGGY-family carbohydrate kinase [Jannaschia ovalis]|uniref:FGGY-family carbohydrate kinase n=1 Tax=Jannaschia ovalis TaxID=3038773 RepID=A0ABY8LF33_9RHOB|nr:FGGY-family carbohydrate kinase [Jannaschia sp. GRR-S6-38]WGH79262.1 FGGY-family carbohydrate kinase [Jannaschia sp. GRR-S6-38]
MSRLALGIDLGTSGIRSAVIDGTGAVVARARAPYPAIDPDRIDAMAWWEGAAACLDAQMAALTAVGRAPDEIGHIAVDGTSGSLVLVDAWLAPVTRGLLYNAGGFHEAARRIAEVAPDPHVARAPASALARALQLVAEDPDGRAAHLLHQADFVTAHLMGRGGSSDANNALKTGYDPEAAAWPDWISDTGLPAHLLPDVAVPGAALGPVAPAIAARFGLSPGAVVHAGTTDSIAAFIAATPLTLGAAVTSLGTTLAIKVLADRRIDRPEIGLYAHRLGPGWLIGGASNTGGGVLLQHFSPEEIARLSAEIDPGRLSGLDYYPLPAPGERFPVNDPDMRPRIHPRPASDADFLHGLLEGIARIEAACYAAVADLGGPDPERIRTAGGGAANATWREIRQRILGRPVETARQTEAAVGAALLARLKA